MENKLKTKIWAVALFFAVTGVVSLLVVLNRNTDVFKGLFSAQQFALQKTVQTVQTAQEAAPKETIPVTERIAAAERFGGLDIVDTIVATGNCEPKSTNIANNSLTVGQLLPSPQILELSSTSVDTPVAKFEFKTKDVSDPREICIITLTGYGDATASDLKISAKLISNGETLGTIRDLPFVSINGQIFKAQLNFPLSDGYRYKSHLNSKEVYLHIFANIPDNANDNKKFRLGIEQKSDITSNASEINISPDDGAFGAEFTIKNASAPVANTMAISPGTNEIQLVNNPAQTQAAAHFDITQTGTVRLIEMQLTAKGDGVGAPLVNPFMFASEIWIYSDGENQPLVSKNIRDVAPMIAQTVPEVIPNTFPPQTRQRQLNKGEIDAIVSGLGPNIDFPFDPQLVLDSAKKINVKIKLRSGLSSDTKFHFGIKNVTSNPSDATKSRLPALGGKITLSDEPLIIEWDDPILIASTVTPALTEKLFVSLKPTNIGSVEIARNAKGVSLGKIIFRTKAANVKIKKIIFHSFGVTDMPFTNIKISPLSSGSGPVTDLTDLSARNRYMQGSEVINLSNTNVPDDNKDHTFYITGDFISGAAVGNATFGISLQNTNSVEATNTVESTPIAPGEIELADVNKGNEFTVKSGATSSTGTLTLTNIVNNVSGHTATAADFPLSIENQTVTVTSGIPITLPATATGTTYKAKSTNSKSTEYTTSGWTGTGCAADGTVTITAGSPKACSITYTVITPVSTTGTLTLTNIINGGTATQADFPLSIEGQTDAGWDVTGGTPVTLPAGTYKAKSTNSKSTEYTTSGWTGEGCAADGTVTITAGSAKACSITYTAIARTTSTLKLINYVVGGPAVEAEFNVFIDGVQFERNTPIQVSPGAHRATTSANVQNYSQSEWRGDCATDGTVTAVIGTDKMCHVTWNFVPPAGAPTCEQQSKVTYTGPTVGTVTNGMCISCSVADFTRLGNTCTPPTPPTTRTCEQQGKHTYTGPEKPGVRTTGMCIDCSMEVYQSLGGTCTATATPIPEPDRQRAPLAVTPNLRGSARLVRAPEQGNTGPEVAIYFGALATAQAVLWMRKKRKKK